MQADLSRIKIPPLHEIRLEIERRQCRTLSGFAKAAWHILEPATELKWGWAPEAICEHLQAVVDGHIRRLLINVPPGTMKSLLTGVVLPAYEWGPCGKPEMRYLGTAHKQDLAVRDSMKCRRLIQSDWFQDRWPIALTGDMNAKVKFENDKTGFREAMAFTSMTGARGDRVILDDPHSVDDANSATKLATDILTFREALPSRVNNEKSAIIIIMQRLHMEDVSAIALELGYEHLCIPMRYEAERKCVTSIGWEDPRTTEGELMFPERFPEHQVIELETTLGQYATAGQLQQRPAPREGGMFKVDQLIVVEDMPVARQRVRGWDIAGSTRKTSPYTAGVQMAEAGGLIYVTHVARARAEIDKAEQLIVDTARNDGLAIKQSLPQDPGQSGKSQRNQLSARLQPGNFKFSPESGAKEDRAIPFASMVNAGCVRLIHGPWNAAFIEELRNFPNSQFKDQVDASSRAYSEIVLPRSTDPGIAAPIIIGN